jgi:hypothetical protein
MRTAKHVAESAIYFIDRLNDLVRHSINPVDALSQTRRRIIDDEILRVLKYYLDENPPLDALIFHDYKCVHRRVIGSMQSHPHIVPNIFILTSAAEFPNEPLEPPFHGRGPFVDITADADNIYGDKVEVWRSLTRYVAKRASEHTNQEPASATYQTLAFLSTNRNPSTLEEQLEELFPGPQIPTLEVGSQITYSPWTIPLPKKLAWWTVTKDVAAVGRYLGGINLRVAVVADGIGALQLSPRPSWTDDGDAPRLQDDFLL